MSLADTTEFLVLTVKSAERVPKTDYIGLLLNLVVRLPVGNRPVSMSAGACFQPKVSHHSTIRSYFSQENHSVFFSNPIFYTR